MTFRIIFFLTIVATLSLGVNWIVENDGTAQFIWLGYEVNTSIAFLIFALTAVIIALIVLLEIVVTLIMLPSRINKKYKTFQLEQDLKQLQTGYAALLSGDIHQAKKVTLKLASEKQSNKYLANLSDMLAAKVAIEEGNTLLAQDYFQKFSENKKQKYFAVKGLLDTAFKQGNIDEAIEYAEEAYELKPNVKNGAHSLLELYKKAGKLDKAEEFLGKYKIKYLLFKDKNNNIDVVKEEFDLWLLKAKDYYENSDGFRPSYELAKKYLGKCLKLSPNNKEVVLLMLKVCKTLKDEKTAKRTMEKAWDELQSYEVGAAYLDVITAPNYKDATKKKLKAIEGLKNISFNPEIIELLKDKIYDVQIEY